jgi:hypothetical protein
MAYSLDIWALSSFPKKLFAMPLQRAGAARRTGARVRLEIGVTACLSTTKGRALCVR